MKSMPTLVAHRGYAARWPENTLPALAAAAAAGARWVEVDVQLSADGIPVLLHDADLARAAGQATPVFELTAAELAEINVCYPTRFGTRFGTEFPAARVATLAEFADWLAAQPGVDAFVELKEESLQHFGRTAVLNACISAMTPAQGRWAPISFDREVLALAGEAGFAELGWVLREFNASVAGQARELPARWLFCNHERLPPGPLPPGPWDWVLYEVADADMACALVARGARWLETMEIGKLRQALREDAAPST